MKHKHSDLIKAWADGAEIQYFGILANRWITIKNPSWDEDEKYRIKPELKELAFKIANEIADQFTSGFCNDRMVEDFARIVDKHLPKQEPLGREIKVPSGSTDYMFGFIDGVKYAEKAHGIGE